MQVTKGCKVENDKTYGFEDNKPWLDVEVSIYNTGFYIVTRIYDTSITLPTVNSTTRNKPQKVIDYIHGFLKSKGIDPMVLGVNWKGYHKFTQDKATGFFTTKI